MRKDERHISFSYTTCGTDTSFSKQDRGTERQKKKKERNLYCSNLIFAPFFRLEHGKNSTISPCFVLLVFKLPQILHQHRSLCVSTKRVSSCWCCMIIAVDVYVILHASALTHHFESETGKKKERKRGREGNRKTMSGLEKHTLRHQHAFYKPHKTKGCWSGKREEILQLAVQVERKEAGLGEKTRAQSNI